MADGRLTGKVAIVTGAASGIGRATALRLAAEGASVVAVDVNAEGTKATVADIAKAGGKAIAKVADISEAANCTSVVATAVSTYGGLNILANMHGVSDSTDTKILSTSEEVFRKTWEVNTKALFLLCKAAIPEMQKAGSGSIVNMSSGAALSGSGGVAYTASKGGVNALTRAVAYQHAAENIRCNTVCPGAIDTPMMHRSFAKLGMTNLPIAPGRIPRIGRPEEVAGLVAFLASDEAAYITAATYTLDGGSTGH
jgi:NAD(P)-dependent dehydrogenase (short-subunit alcohol dehydrogenase family)